MENNEINIVNPIIKLWVNKKINYAKFEFQCGGDSMGDTYWFFYDNQDKQIPVIENDKALTTILLFLENEVYNRVNFYEASDGHYEGEFGDVIVKYNKDLKDFEFEKNSRTEWREMINGTFEIDLTEIETKFLKSKVTRFRIVTDEDVFVEFNGDTILSESEDEIITNIGKKIELMSAEFTIDDSTEFNGYPYDYFMSSANVEKIKEDKLLVEIQKEYMIVRDGEEF